MRKERKKKTKNDALVRLAAVIHEVRPCPAPRSALMLLARAQPARGTFAGTGFKGMACGVGAAQGGREGVETEWEATSEFHDAWKAKARDMLARAEWRRRKLTKRVRGALPPLKGCMHRSQRQSGAPTCSLARAALQPAGPCKHLPCRLTWLPVRLQLAEETERLEEEEGEMRKKLKATREHTKQWEQTRETRARVLGPHTHPPSVACCTFLHQRWIPR